MNNKNTVNAIFTLLLGVMLFSNISLADVQATWRPAPFAGKDLATVKVSVDYGTPITINTTIAVAKELTNKDLDPSNLSNEAKVAIQKLGVSAEDLKRAAQQKADDAAAAGTSDQSRPESRAYDGYGFGGNGERFDFNGGSQFSGAGLSYGNGFVFGRGGQCDAIR